MTGSNPSVTDYILEVPGRTTQRCASRHSGQLAIDLRHVRSRSQKRILEICFNHGVRHQYRNVPLATAVVLVRAADHSIASLYHRPQIPQYKVVDHVRRTRAVARPQFKDAEGRVAAVVDNDTGSRLSRYTTSSLISERSPFMAPA